MLQPSLTKNDKKAKLLIYTVSIVVFVTVVLLSRYKLQVDLGFDVHLFAKANAIINSIPVIDFHDISQPVLPATGTLQEYQTVQQRISNAKLSNSDLRTVISRR